MSRFAAALLVLAMVASPVRAQWVDISESGSGYVYLDFAIHDGVIAASTEIADMRISTDGGQTWSDGGGDEMRAVVSVPDGFWASAGTGFNYTGEASGTSWTNLGGNIGIVTNLFYDEISGRLYAPSQNYNIAYSDDGGINWGFLPVANRDNEFTWVHARGDVVFAGYNQGGGMTFLSTDGGESFSDIGINTTSAGFVAENGDLYLIGPQPTNSRSSPLLRSTDSGLTWETVFEAPGLGGVFGGQGTPGRQKGFIFVDGSSIMFAINARVYVSHDGGQNFDDMSDGLVDPGAGDSAIKTLEIADGYFYVLVVDNDAEGPSQYGYGIYRRPVDELGFATNVAVEEVDVPAMDVRLWPNPLTGSGTIEFTAPEAAPVSVSAVDMLGREVMHRDLGTAAVGTHRIDLSADDLAPGTYVLRIASGESVRTKLLTVAR